MQYFFSSLPNISIASHLPSGDQSGQPSPPVQPGGQARKGRQSVGGSAQATGPSSGGSSESDFALGFWPQLQSPHLW